MKILFRTDSVVPSIFKSWWGDTAGPKYPGNNSSSGDWAYWGETDGDIIFNPHLTAEP